MAMADEDRRALEEMINGMECDSVRISWGRICLTCDRTATINALDALASAIRSINVLLKVERDKDAASKPVE